MSTTDSLREEVRQKYAEAATGAGCGCGDGGCCSDAEFGSSLYEISQRAELPDAAVLASLGCGNPTAVADLREGETVLDLGSGGGIDVLLSARRVGATGFAYGLDMTDEMLALARRNAAERGVANVSFLKGHIEAIPLPDASVDVVISNCVINLSADKPRVIAEAFRVLRPGGRFAVSDVVVQGRLADEVRRDMELWAGCIAGALEEDAYTSLLGQAGFEQVGVEVTRVYEQHQTADGRLVSAFVRATKPHG
jgi:SAM-dependent methyltransferase